MHQLVSFCLCHWPLELRVAAGLSPEGAAEGAGAPIVLPRFTAGMRIIRGRPQRRRRLLSSSAMAKMGNGSAAAGPCLFGRQRLTAREAVLQGAEAPTTKLNRADQLEKG